MFQRTTVVCSGNWCTFGLLVPAGRRTATLNSWASIVFKVNQWSTSACEFLTHSFSADDRNLFYREKQDELVLLKSFFENIPKWLSVSQFALNIDETQTVIFSRNGGGADIHSSDSILDQSTCVKCLGNKISKLFFSFSFCWCSQRPANAIFSKITIKTLNWKNPSSRVLWNL